MCELAFALRLGIQVASSDGRLLGAHLQLGDQLLHPGIHGAIHSKNPTFREDNHDGMTSLSV